MEHHNTGQDAPESRLLPFRIPPKTSPAERGKDDQHFVDLLQAAFFISAETTRQEKELFLEGLIDLLDKEDGDPDMEPDADTPETALILAPIATAAILPWRA